MLYLVLALVGLPLVFGIWFLLLPQTVPFWVVQIPLAIVDLFWKTGLKEMDPRSRQDQFFTPINRDPNYRDYQIDQMQGLADQVAPTKVSPGRVQAVGFAIVALWLVAAFALKSCAASLQKSTRESRVQTSP